MCTELTGRTKDNETVKYSLIRWAVVAFAGKNLPKHILLYKCPVDVRNYIFSGNAVLQLFKRWPYQEPKQKDECDNPLKCANCSGGHYSTNKTCPKFLLQKEIKTKMAYDNLTYLGSQE